MNDWGGGLPRNDWVGGLPRGSRGSRPDGLYPAIPISGTAIDHWMEAHDPYQRGSELSEIWRAGLHASQRRLHESRRQSRRAKIIILVSCTVTAVTYAYAAYRTITGE